MLFDVVLYVYDLSGGLARALSTVILGKYIEGIWHTSVVVHGKEIFYGSHGISCCEPSGTMLREPLEKIPMGYTDLSETELFTYLEHLSKSLFRGGDYRLFDHNCNTFSNFLINHLTGREIPAHILQLPAEVASTPLGAALKPALNTLSTGLNNIPQFGNESIEKGRNNHSVESIKKDFRPILFDEPLSSTIAPHQVELLWTADTDHMQLATHARILSELLTAQSGSIICDPSIYQLLDLSLLETSDQCQVVLDLFRLAIWRSPDLLTSLLTDPKRHLHNLATSPVPSEKPSVTLDLTASKAKLLCNCLGLSYDWHVEEDSDLLLDTKPMVRICLLLLGHDDYQLPGTNTRKERPLPEHLQVALALAHNIALYPHVPCEEAIELGTYLLHLAVSQNKSYKQPIEAIYLLRTIYFLIVRYPFLADLARACDLRGCLTIVMSEITHPDNSSLYRSVTKERPTNLQRASSSNSGPTDEISADYVMVKLLIDFLDGDSSK